MKWMKAMKGFEGDIVKKGSGLKELRAKIMEGNL